MSTAMSSRSGSAYCITASGAMFAEENAAPNAACRNASRSGIEGGSAR